MDRKVHALLFFVAFICFIVVALSSLFPPVTPERPRAFGRVDLLALGLALFDFVFFWNAFKAS